MRKTRLPVSLNEATWIITDSVSILFQVADDGPGVPRRHRLHVFKKYYQAERSQAMGSGLGLAIARELVEAHGGWIELGEKGPDDLGGALFNVWVPTRARGKQKRSR